MATVLRAKTAGFCMGVGLAPAQARSGPQGTQGPQLRQAGHARPHHPQPASHEHVHAAGVVLAHSLDAVQPGTPSSSGHTAYRAKTKRACSTSGAHVLDATCPKVKQAQLAIDEATRRGTSLYLFGEAEHPEDEGLVSLCQQPMPRVWELEGIERKTDVQRYPQCGAGGSNHAGTRGIRSHQKTLAEGHSLSVLETICDATRRRQQEALMISQQAEAMIVVGGKNKRKHAPSGRCGGKLRHCGVAHRSTGRAAS